MWTNHWEQPDSLVVSHASLYWMLLTDSTEYIRRILEEAVSRLGRVSEPLLWLSSYNILKSENLLLWANLVVYGHFQLLIKCSVTRLEKSCPTFLYPHWKNSGGCIKKLSCSSNCCVNASVSPIPLRLVNQDLEFLGTPCID